MARFKKGQIPWNKNMKVDRTKFPSMGHFKKNSEETKRKISESTKKAMANPEVRKKISEARKGKKPWNKGKKTGHIPWIKGKTHSEESKKRMSEFQKRLWSNLAYIKKMSKVHIGKPSPRKGKRLSPETLKKLSESHKGKPSSRKGKHHTEEAKKKISEYTKKSMSNPEIRKKFIEANRKRYANPESLEKIKKHSRETLLRLYESGAFPRQENTKPERQIKEELLKRGYIENEDFIHQYKFMNKFMCDFCFPQQKVIVEVYGDFWHANPQKYLVNSKLHPHQIKGIGRDKAKKAYITKVDNNTWIYLVLWESDIKKDVSKCVDRIEDVLAEKS